MKKLDTQFIAAGSAQPIKQGTLNLLQEAYQECLDALAQGLIIDATGVTILFGCVDSGGGAGTYNISAGAVYYGGEIYLVDATGAFTPGGGNTAVATILISNVNAVNADPVKFTDLNTHNVHIIRKAVIGSGVSGSGIADFSAIKNVFESFHVVPVGSFNTGWSSGTSILRYRKASKRVTIQGQAVYAGGGAQIPFTLPVGYRPAYDFYRVIVASSNGLITFVWIKTNGDVEVLSTATQTFDINVSFYLD